MSFNPAFKGAASDRFNTSASPLNAIISMNPDLSTKQAGRNTSVNKSRSWRTASAESGRSVRHHQNTSAPQNQNINSYVNGQDLAEIIAFYCTLLVLVGACSKLGHRVLLPSATR